MDAATTRHMLAALLGMAMAGFALWTAARIALRRVHWPPIGCTVPTWTLAETVLVQAMVWITPLMFSSLLQLLGFFRRYYGTDPDLGDVLAVFRAGLWGSLGYPITALAIFGLLKLVSDTTPARLGISSRGFGDQMCAGVLGFLVITPLVLGLHYLIGEFYRVSFVEKPVKHVLEILAKDGPRPAEWVLILLQAVVFAAFFEELIFRGLLQPWAARRWWGGAACWVIALVVAFSYTGQTRGPLAMVLFLGFPQAILLHRRWHTEEESAILGGSTLFAILHASVWPSPIPLFILALGLGWLRRRTQSLWPPILVHGMFNAVSTLMLLLNVTLQGSNEGN